MVDIANYRETRRILEQYQAHAKKHFGQNFIIDPSVVRTIAQKSQAHPDQMTLEIGPGLGSLTQQLARVSKTVVAYEIDPIMIEILKETMSESHNVEIIFEDFLKADLSVYEGQDVVVCANVPYYITTPILFKLLQSNLNVKAMTLMMQKEIADRLNAVVGSKQYSSLSILFQYFFEMKKIMNVSKESFYPQPRVDSSVIQFIPRADRILDASEVFFDFVHQCFNQRRKTIANNLKNIGYDKEDIDILQDQGVNLQLRPEQLMIEDFLKIYQILKNKNENPELMVE